MTTKEKIIYNKIAETDYNSDSIVLGNVNLELMRNTRDQIIPAIKQNIVTINLLHSSIYFADKTDNKLIIYEYFWGLIYNYLYSNPDLKKKYIDSNIEEKLAFFNKLLLQNEINKDMLYEKDLLFMNEPRKIVSERDNCDFRICILNYQEISSLCFAQYLNLLTRERPQITILTSEQGLKTCSTGNFNNSVGDDFHYYNINDNSNGPFKIEKVKCK